MFSKTLKSCQLIFYKNFIPEYLKNYKKQDSFIYILNLEKLPAFTALLIDEAVLNPIHFYEIKSKKSEQLLNGVRQFTLSSEDLPQVDCFLWLNERDQLVQFQIIFDEKLLEWRFDKGFIASETNRRNRSQDKSGTLKGARTIHETRDSNILKEGMDIVKYSIFPPDFTPMMRETLQ